MIKKYNQYIKESKYFDIDPYGEEDWDDDDFSPILQIARKTRKPYDQIFVLYCFHKQLNSLEGIEKLINLRHLYFDKNELTSLEGIENLTKLELIYCQNNQFTDEYKEYLKVFCKSKKISFNI